ncbi:hypothetical protein [Mycoplasma sp. P36-A1]|uniref:hypothetical protein n=1 Tax=Mycoplasma sp. P36-A1 TaxID=3252900 RepID=UPI003C2FFBF7
MIIEQTAANAKEKSYNKKNTNNLKANNKDANCILKNKKTNSHKTKFSNNKNSSSNNLNNANSNNLHKRLKYKDIPINKRKYRISIVESMSELKVKQYGFEKSYFLFEKSINHMEKEGDKAERAALNYLKDLKVLGNNYSCNRVITLNSIRIEADIIDYDNKIIYETKSRKTGIQAKMAIKKKWAIFEFDKKNSIYADFIFKGIVVSNYTDGMKIKGIASFENDNIDKIVTKRKFESHFQRIENFRNIRK